MKRFIFTTTIIFLIFSIENIYAQSEVTTLKMDSSGKINLPDNTSISDTYMLDINEFSQGNKQRSEAIFFFHPVYKIIRIELIDVNTAKMFLNLSHESAQTWDKQDWQHMLDGMSKNFRKKLNH